MAVLQFSPSALSIIGKKIKLEIPWRIIIFVIENGLMIQKQFAFLFLCILILHTGHAQVFNDQKPASSKLSREKLDYVVFESQPEMNTSLQLQEFPLYAGHTLVFDEALLSHGQWSRTVDGIHVWRLGIEVQDAKKLNIYLKNLRLSPEQYLFLYSKSGEQIIGAYTHTHNRQQLGSPLIVGNTIIIELNSSVVVQRLPFTLSEIGVLTHGTNATRLGFGDAGSCEIPINCGEGLNWHNQKGGIAKVFVKVGSSLAWCSGSLVNNTKNDGRPYFLTANHCGQQADEEDYNNWVFYFNYEGPYCERPLDEPDLYTLTGSKLMAKSPTSTAMGSDFKLLLLHDDVPKSYNPYYNGWDRSGNASSSGISIHHPQGDIKMISTYLNPTVSSQYYGEQEDEEGFYWRVNWAETNNGHGVTEGGSSGSPLFNDEGLIMGSLTGGTASCTFLDDPDYYGKFSHSWDGHEGDSSNRLQPWLDPENTGVINFPGSSLDSTQLIANFSASETRVLVGGSVNFNNLSYGNIENYQWEFEGGEPKQSFENNPAAITYNNSGIFNVRLIVNSGDYADTTTMIDYIHVSPVIAPNPGPGIFSIRFGDQPTDQVSLEIFDLLGRNIGFSSTINGDNSITIDLGSQSRGLYLVVIHSENGIEVQKAVVSK